MHDAAELLSFRIQNIDAARSTAVDVAGYIHLKPIGATGVRSSKIGEDPIGVLGQGAIRQQVEGANQSAAKVGNIDHALIGREGETVWKNKVVRQERHGTEVG